MKLLQKLGLVLCLALLCTSFSKAQTLDPTQVYTTPNIINPTVAGSGTTPWVGGVYQDSLTCWGWGDPGYCGPNAIVRPGDNINFSYGLTNLYQIQSIANVLPNSGSGLRVNGYNFSFTAKNGNGWDNGGLDYLTAYVSFYDPKGSVVYNKNYDLNYQFNWTTFNYSETFNNPYATKDLGSVQYGFVGRDNNFWAGPYGPEIYNVSFSLKYSVDPCATNTLYSPSCPGYLDAINSFSKPTTTSEPILAPTSTGTSITVSGVTTQPTTSTEQNTIVSPTVSAISTTSQTTTQSSATQPPAQTKVGEVQQAGSTKQSTVSLSQILSIVSNEQSRIGGVEKAAVQNANEQAAKLSEQAKQEAESVASSITSQSISGSIIQSTSNSFGIVSQSTNQSSVMTAPQQQTSIVNIANRPQSTAIIQQTIQPQVQIQQYNQQQSQQVTSSPIVQSVTNSSSFELLRAPQQSIEIDIPKNEGIKLTGRNPISDYLVAPIVLQSQTEQRTETVKQNVQNNEIAGGVDITLMAKQPTGYAQYMISLTDAPFYSPKEIYKNQNTVDNVRIMRGLTGRSDSLHEEMVRQQYRLGN